MGEIIIKVPRKKREVQLIKSDKVFDELAAERQEMFKKKFQTDLSDISVPGAKQKDSAIDSGKFTEEVIEEEIEVENVFDTDIKEITDTDLLEEQTKIDATSLTEIASNAENFLQNELQTEITAAIKAEVELENDYNPIPPKAIFTELYTISDENEPFQIPHPVIEQTETVALEAMEQAVQSAYNKGYADAKEMSNIEAKELVAKAHIAIKRIDKLMTDLRAHYSVQVTEAKHKITDTALAVAETILEYEVDSDKNFIVNHVNRMLTQIDDGSVFSIKINPADYEALVLAQTDVVNSKISGVTLVKDESIDKGSCILTTSLGVIDTTFTTQLRQIRTELQLIENEELPTKEEFISSSVPEIEPAVGMHSN